MADLYLVDATYELFRAFFGVPSMKAPDGREVGGVYGVLSTVIALIDGHGVTHLAAATDHVIESWRNEVYPFYKTGAGIDPDLLGQFGLVEEGLTALGVLTWPMVEFEADDAIGSAVHRYRDRFDRVVIASPDKDFAQLVGDNVVLWDRSRDKRYDEAGVLEKWGVRPASIPDWLALVGDAADGFPGLPGWGAKSASAVLSRYGTVEAIPDEGWDVKVRGAARLAATLRERRAEALLYKRLATLRTDAPIEGELAFTGPTPAFPDFCARLGFDRRLLERAAALQSLPRGASSGSK